MLTPVALPNERIRMRSLLSEKWPDETTSNWTCHQTTCAGTIRVVQKGGTEFDDYQKLPARCSHRAARDRRNHRTDEPDRHLVGPGRRRTETAVAGHYRHRGFDHAAGRPHR